MVFAMSSRFRRTLLLGPISCICIYAAGEYAISNFELQSQFNGLQDNIASKIFRKSDKAGLFSWFSFWMLSYKFYQRDKDKYW